MSSSNSTRVHYFDGQFLRRQDLANEQSYHLAARRRHRIGHHRWGIVRGLELVLDSDGLPAVLPGFAVDGYGRDLVVAESVALATSAFDEKDSEELEVFLVYDRRQSEPAPAGWAGCAGRSRREDAFYRFTECPRVRLARPDPAFTDARRPRSVPEGDLDFGPERTPPDTVSDDWPVLLGTLRRDLSDPAAPVFTVDGTRRPYAGLVAAAVNAPAGGARLELGGDGTDPASFAVFVPGKEEAVVEVAAGVEEEAGEEGNEAGAAEPCKMEVRAELEVHGDVEIRDGFLEIAVPNEPAAAAEPSPRPWQIYRHRGPDGVEELRVEMAAEESAVRVGAFTEGAFQGFLEVRRSERGCTVVIPGDLVLGGALRRPDGTVVPRTEAGLSLAAQGFEKAGALGGIVGSPSLFPFLGGEGEGSAPNNQLLNTVTDLLTNPPQNTDDLVARLPGLLSLLQQQGQGSESG